MFEHASVKVMMRYAARFPLKLGAPLDAVGDGVIPPKDVVFDRLVGD
jgi:hypothetical protein